VGVDIFWMGIAALSLVGTIVLVRLSTRPPRCRACGTQAVVAPDQTSGACPLAIEIAYRCPDCARIVERRHFTALWE
jgi:hypothetical protein